MAGQSGGRPKKSLSIPEMGNDSIGEEVIMTEETQALGQYPLCLLTLNSSWAKANMSLIQNIGRKCPSCTIGLGYSCKDALSTNYLET